MSLGDALPPQLRWLILTDNRIESLPKELGERRALQKLMLAGNCLRSLPDSLRHCHRLELLRIAANQLNELPQWLLTLPSLTWLAYAGNPLETEADAAALEATPLIDWSTLRMEQQLGEGASGVISRAVWQRDDGTAQAVAVKLYKGEMTSDGSPLHEMNACITAGLHPNLIRVEGRISGHPDQQQGLVMQLIDPSFEQSRRLAEPGLVLAGCLCRGLPVHGGGCPARRPRHRLSGRAPAPPRHYPRRSVWPQHSVERSGRLSARGFRRGVVSCNPR